LRASSSHKLVALKRYIVSLEFLRSGSGGYTAVGGVQQVPASLFTAVASGLEKLNVSADRLVEKAGLPMWHDEDPRTLVPGVHYYRLVGSGAR